MATRTYKTDDWKVWTYQPTAGDFRLDFSLLDGSDVLGTTRGSMGVITLPISSISISDGGELTNGSLLPITGSTATIEFEILNFNKSDVTEFYNGKRIVVTNPATTSNIDYGYNSVLFEGMITNSNISLDTSSNIAILSISCESLWSSLLNQQTSITKNTTDLKSTFWIQQLWAEAVSGGQYIITTGSGVTTTSHYGTTGNKTDTYGTFLDDLLNSETLFAAPELVTATNYFTSYIKLYRLIDLTTTGYVTIPGTNIYNVAFANNPADVPSNYALTSEAGASLNSNSSVNNTLGSSINYTASVDVKDATELQTIIDRMSVITQKLSPIVVDVVIARNNQPITYTTQPELLQTCGKAIKANLSEWGFSSTETMYVTGRTITVTPDDFKVSYIVTKGK
jgi:hypothetical protein